MDRNTQIELIDELLRLKQENSAFLDETVTASPVERYTSAERFAEEQRLLFRRVPIVAGHASELDGPDAFLTRSLLGLPLLLTRDSEGHPHAFLNVCRHRGARLVDDTSGCRKSFSCPYHAWTYTNSGALKGIPHEEMGFPELDRTSRGLQELPLRERFGFLWVLADPLMADAFDAQLDTLADELAWLELENHAIAAADRFDCGANWKVLVEGGIESYHFKVAHRNTIGPHFMNNLSSYQPFGNHLRSVLPRESLVELADHPTERWDIRSSTNVLYSLFPTTQLLVMQDHVAWVWMNPLGADRTEVQITTLAPTIDINAAKHGHWHRNQQITTATLREDFALGESIQSGFASGANDDLVFGRFEGALHHFNQVVEAHLSAAA